MFTLRPTTPADAETITQQRRQMFLDAGLGSQQQIDAMARAFTPWVKRKIEDDLYLGWFAEDADHNIAAGAGIYLMEFPPHWLDPAPLRAYLLNFYVGPAFRKQGLANKLLRRTVEETQLRKIKVVTLHASRFGKPIYEKFGFEQTDEMRFLNHFEEDQ